MPRPARFLDPPEPEDIRSIARKQHLDPSPAELDFIERYAAETLAAYRHLDGLSTPAEPDPYPEREQGAAPSTDEDPYGAFARTCTVRGADAGPLAGYRVGVKDNVAVAGIETTYGTRLMAGYVPTRDATVVSRLLDAGATITGKLTMSPLSFSDGFDRPGRNPRDPSRSAGGSSTGSAIAVVTDDVDVAIGVDQGGSIRQPAAWCGCIGLKPTRGLVPFTGIQSIEDTLDHVGPMARTVDDCARTLGAMGGPDPLDHRQAATPTPDRYRPEDEADLDELSIGVITEGFDDDEANGDVLAVVRRAIDRFADLGASITEVSIPMHLSGPALWQAIFVEGLAMKIEAAGLSPFAGGWQDEQFAGTFGSRRRERGNELPLRITAALVLGDYVGERAHHRYYARAKNLARALTRAYDEALVDVDVLALPTWPDVASEIPTVDSERDAIEATIDTLTHIDRSWTKPFNVSGHPALSLPCGTVDDLPVGLQLVGAFFQEDVLFRAARAFERDGGWDDDAIVDRP